MRRLTLKQKDFAKKVVETKNTTEAAMQAYPCKRRIVAANIGARLWKNDRVRAEIERILASHDVTEDVLSKKINEGLSANKTANFEGEVTESDIPDFDVRHKYIQEAAKLMDLYPSQKIESRNLNVDLELDKMKPEQIKALLEGLLSSLTPKYPEKAIKENVN